MSFLDELKKRKLNQSKEIKKDLVDKKNEDNNISHSDNLNKSSFISQTSKLRSNISNSKKDSKKDLKKDSKKIIFNNINTKKNLINHNDINNYNNHSNINNSLEEKLIKKNNSNLKNNIDKNKNKESNKDKKELLLNLKNKIISILNPEFDNLKINKSDINKIFLDVKKEIGIYKKRVKKEKESIKSDDSNLNQEEIERIMAESKNMGLEHEIVSNLFFKLGMKLFEIAQLKIEDINFNNGKIKLNDKTFEMDSGTAAKLLAYIGSRNTGVLVTKNNDKLSKDEILGFIKTIMDAAHVQKKENIESLVENFQNSLRKEGKPYMYWDYIDQVVELRTKSIKKN